MAKRFDPIELELAISDAIAFILQETAKSVHRTLVLASPVGDPTLWQDPDRAPPGYVGGTFRRNWLVQVGGGAPSDFLEGDYDPSGAMTIDEGATEIELFADGTEPVWIFNGAPYANRLNNGWSTQAPAGFVEQAIADGVVGAIPGPREL